MFFRVHCPQRCCCSRLECGWHQCSSAHFVRLSYLSEPKADQTPAALRPAHSVASRCVILLFPSTRRRLVARSHTNFLVLASTAQSKRLMCINDTFDNFQLGYRGIESSRGPISNSSCPSDTRTVILGAPINQLEHTSVGIVAYIPYMHALRLSSLELCSKHSTKPMFLQLIAYPRTY